MQARFMFRVWHEPLKQMHYNDFVITSTGYVAKIYQQDDYMMKFNQSDLEFDKQCIVMQCTGIKDKSGKFIFEGDICRHTKNNKIFSVVWHGTFASFVWSKHKHSTISEYGELFRAFDYYEVIGNIYENPELLNEANQ